MYTAKTELRQTLNLQFFSHNRPMNPQQNSVQDVGLGNLNKTSDKNYFGWMPDLGGLDGQSGCNRGDSELEP